LKIEDIVTRRFLLALALAAPSVFPAGPAMDPARLSLIPQRLREYVDSGAISGAVTLVARHGEVAALHAAGWQDVEARKPMRTDTIVQIMSQTKSVTGVAAMMLVEEGRLDLQRPVQDYLPEFKGQLVEEKRDGVVTAHPPRHPPTVAELLSHTSGLAFLPAKEMQRINYTLDATLEEAVKVYARERLVAEPGATHLYSNMGIATVGRIIEVISGEDYARFVTGRILAPLGMKDTFFFPPEEKKGRIAMVYLHENGKLALARERAQAGDPARYRAGAKYPGPELGLYSTAEDLFRFYQMLAARGVYGGRRYLSEQSVRAMTKDYTPEHRGYGLSLTVANGPQSLLNLLSPGSFGHGGAFGTEGWVDPENDLVMIFLGQMTDGSAGPARAAVRQIAESAVR
jgi:CubicO group peptidase (beta-lactamase class C family)